MADVLFIGTFQDGFISAVSSASGCTSVQITGPAKAIAQVRQKPETFDAVVMSLRMEGMDGLDAMDEILRVDPDLPVIISTHDTQVQTIVGAMQRGAYNYQFEPNAVQELPFLLKRALSYMHAIRENRRLAELDAAPGRSSEFIGVSSETNRIREIIAQTADSSLPVLITGESGTGKEVAARMLHFQSPRREREFIAVNCGALSPTLLEAELFGYVKGAFTGADRDHKGIFEQADESTLFLDEIGTTEPAFQVRLLRAIEQGEIRRVGDEKTRKVNVRIIAASNSSPEEGVKNGTFRKDLFYRLNVIPINIPPLCRRIEDIPVLARFFLESIKRTEQKAPSGFTHQAVSMLEKHDWPGNGRELRNVIERAALMCNTDRIRPTDFPPYITSRTAGIRVSPGEGLNKAVADFEKSLIRQTLEEASGNRAETARRLGLNRTTLVAKMKRLGIT